MRKQLDDQLCTKYPEIFTDRDASVKRSCMAFGFECGDGWFDILDELCTGLQTLTEQGAPQVVAAQVKEKFGGLRFYVNGANDKQYELIREAERKSYETCENCGSEDDVTSSGAWVTTLCGNCRVKA